MITEPARIPPHLPDLQPGWSRLVTIADADGTPIGVHVLDNRPPETTFTLVCVHGNPTWSYLWRNVIAAAPPNVRVIAVDQVDMGYSARTSGVRRLAQRIDDLDAIIEALGIEGPLAVMAHDWGGPVALGWTQRAALSDRWANRILGVVLTNTAVHQPAKEGFPKLIAAARLAPLRRAVTATTTTFLRGTTAISSVDRAHAKAFRAPYGTKERREAISDFVADIPVETDHPSAPTLDAIADGMSRLSGVPMLLVWGMRDPVFAPRYLDDLRRRAPHAHVQQFSDAGHLVLEDRPDAVADIWVWLTGLLDGSREPGSEDDVTGAVPEPGTRLIERARDAGTEAAVSEFVKGRLRQVSWGLLETRVRQLARGLAGEGIKPGERVAVLIPPGADLIATVYALWRLGATVVVIDAAHRPPAMIRSLRGARVQHIIAVRHAAPIVWSLRVPGHVVWRDQLAELASRAEAGSPDDDASVEVAESVTDPSDDAVVVFTSGATGPAKPVAYSWARLAATAATLQGHYAFQSDDVLVAAFAPWAVLGPLLGLASVIPQMDASRPGTLTATALADAIDGAGGTVMWASPAAMRSVLSGAPEGSAERVRLAESAASLRLLLIAGAPVSRALLSDAAACWPACDVRTPYGMTEVLPATDVGAAEVLAESAELGVLVGRPLPGVAIAIAPLGLDGVPSDELTDQPDVLGEVAISAPHAKSRYDGRAFDEQRSGRNPGWHRTGDIGRLDGKSRLWINGRLSHVITTANGPVGPVEVEQRIETGLDNFGNAGISVAAVGVGPVGTQVIVIVCAPQRSGGDDRIQLASLELTEQVRALEPAAAAVLWREKMPVDIRHGAKVDRSVLAREASRVLAGHQ